MQRTDLIGKALRPTLNAALTPWAAQRYSDDPELHGQAAVVLDQLMDEFHDRFLELFNPLLIESIHREYAADPAAFQKKYGG